MPFPLLVQNGLAAACNDETVQESELTPTGANLLDGRYAVFGYLIDGAALLQQAQVQPLEVAHAGEFYAHKPCSLSQHHHPAFLKSRLGGLRNQSLHRLCMSLRRSRNLHCC